MNCTPESLPRRTEGTHHADTEADVASLTGYCESPSGSHPQHSTRTVQGRLRHDVNHEELSHTRHPTVRASDRRMSSPGVADLADSAAIAGWIRDAHHVMALTGAGISTDSGIPDFRGPNGVWTKDPKAERLSHIDTYLADRSVRVESWQRRIAHPALTAGPHPGPLPLPAPDAKGHPQSLLP